MRGEIKWEGRSFMGETKSLLGRREILKTSAMVLGGTLLAESMEAYPKGVNTNSSPSTLKITDMRVATIVMPGPSPGMTRRDRRIN